MTRMLFFTLAICSFLPKVEAQQYNVEIRIGNYGTGLPVSSYPALVYSNFNPGIDGGISYQLNQNPKHQWSISGNLGLFYHRFIQTGVKLYPSIDYQYNFSGKWSLRSSFDLGYLLAVNNVAVLELQDDGEYQGRASLKARSQFMVGLRFGLAYNPSGLADGMRWTAAVGTFMQGPYVAGYVPLLPYNTFSLGFEIPLNLSNSRHD